MLGPVHLLYLSGSNFVHMYHMYVVFVSLVYLVSDSKLHCGSRNILIPEAMLYEPRGHGCSIINFENSIFFYQQMEIYILVISCTHTNMQ